MKNRTEPGAAVGDVVVLDPRHLGSGRRLGEIVEVLGAPEHERYRVRWDDEHESIFYPQSSDARIVRQGRGRRPRAANDKRADPIDDEPVLRHEP